MKALRYLLYFILTLVALFLITGLFVKKDYHVERSATIDAPRDVVYAKLNKFAHFNEWSPWASLDPNMTSKIEGEDGKVGAKYAWEGDPNTVGKGSLTTLSTSPDRIEQDLHFEGMGNSPVYFTLKENGNKTDVAWGIDMHVPYPFNAMNLIYNPEKMLTESYDTGLASLKNLIEGEQANLNKYKSAISAQDVPQRIFVGYKQTVKMDAMGPFFEKSYTALGNMIGANIAGPPCGLYYTLDEEKGESEMAAAFPINEKANYGDPLAEYVYVGGKALVIDYFGAPEGSAAAHYAMDAYIKENGLKSKEPVLEEYLVGADSGKPVEEHHTRIIYFLEE